MDFENEEIGTDPEIKEYSKLDSLWIGLILGFLAPVISFLAFYYSNFTKVSFDYFIHYSIRIGALINIFTVSLIPDFIIFALFIWRSHYRSAKGMVIASATITGLLVIAKILIEFYLR